MKLRVAISLLGIISLFATIASAKKTPDISAFGDHSLWVLTNDIKETFQMDTGISFYLIPEFALGGKGCAKGIMHASSGSPDKNLGLICCDLNENIIKKHNLKVYPVAKEPLAIIVNKNNPVSGLTLKEVRDIFSGKITNWKEVGGQDAKIIVTARLHCKEHTANWTKILPTPSKFKANSIHVSSEPDMARTVSDFKYAIGHLEMTSIIELRFNIKPISIDDHMPTSKNLKDRLYPLSATLSVVTKGEAGKKVMEFINYIRTSPKTASVMQKYGMHPTE